MYARFACIGGMYMLLMKVPAIPDGSSLKPAVEGRETDHLDFPVYDIQWLVAFKLLQVPEEDPSMMSSDLNRWPCDMHTGYGNPDVAHRCSNSTQSGVQKKERNNEKELLPEQLLFLPRNCNSGL